MSGPASAGAAPPPPRLALDGLTRRFGAFTALDGVSLDLRAGEVHCLLGENGAGKSTLCNLVFGVHAPDAGGMRIDGRPYRPTGPRDALAAGIAMVHQHFSLVDELSVVDNLMLGRVRGVLDRGAWARRLDALAERYGLALKPFARVGSLSIGERQRVEIVKCLMAEPRLLILDEPSLGLSPLLVEEMFALVRTLNSQGLPIMLVEQNVVQSLDLATRAYILENGTVALEGDAATLAADPALRRAYLGL